MILKERKKPIKLLALEALFRRIPQDHIKKECIESELIKRKAGYKGERNLDFHLSYCDLDDALILNDVRLIIKNSPFQVDTIIIFPHFILLIESKYYMGTLTFDDHFKQMRRIIGDDEEAYLHPVLQVQRHSMLFRQWLLLKNIPIPTVEFVVVMSNPSVVLKSGETELSRNIIRIDSLYHFINDLKRNNSTATISKVMRGKMANLILQNHAEHHPDILNQFQIQPRDIICGVQCPHCKFIPMQRKRKKWYCTRCHEYSTNAHYEAINDYFLLFKNYITNQEGRDFLKVDSRYVVKRLLRSLNLEERGETSGRKYYWKRSL
ncbi:nuclease-related domain-containing protein [Bacillus kexueae]|uniref:nuclease-related domain-containing protein n=1 Tax=Aeribacillus kexueae TaxID=2078952 RepID=UPI001FAF63EB|nr:nuclease-related domain-containing protein [Bacillus kexueae]